MEDLDSSILKITNDLVIWDDDSKEIKLMRSAADRLTFDGYKLIWHKGSSATAYTGFSGLADETARESEKDRGPIPQGEFAIDPGNIEVLEKNDDWGSNRVKVEPLKLTVDRMKNCFGVVRTAMYVHGGEAKGTIGCIELNNDDEEAEFFKKLKKYGKKIQLIVAYTGDRKKKYEETKCPYKTFV